MADRREPPKPGTPEYRWLYGDPDETRPTDVGRGQKRPIAQSDETRVMPVVLPPERPRQDRRAPSRPTAYQPPAPPASPPRRPVAPPPGSSPSGPPSQSWKPRRSVKRWVLLALAAWLAFLVLTPVLALRGIETVSALPAGERPADQPGTTYLVTGSDSREGLTAAQRRRLHTGGDVGQRTDTIMLLHIGAGPDLLMSIPRDSLVEVPGHGVTKINAAFSYGGPQLLVQTVEQNTGIRIDDYVEIGMGGVVKLVNAVGGITICPTQDMDDPLANLHVKKGCQQANGRKALAYARSRHTSGLGDIDRAKHQREVVGQVGKKAVSPWSVLNPVRYWKLTHAGASTLTVSDGTGSYALARFALAMSSPDKSCVVPLADLAVHWDSERSARMFTLIREDRTDEIGKGLCTDSGLAR